MTEPDGLHTTGLAMNDLLARQAFDAIFAAYELNESDAAWHVFLAGWNARVFVMTEHDISRLKDFPKEYYDA